LNIKTTYSEQELVALLQERNEKAFGYLYDNYSAALYGIVNSIIIDKEIANDVLQNVFINIWRKIESYDASKGRLFTWMLNIARNASIDEFRSKGFRHSQQNQSLNDNVDVPGASAGPVVEDVGLKKVLTNL
jgi:RNA polymerase sigma-70 factor (ECF subfamily)